MTLGPIDMDRNRMTEPAPKIKAVIYYTAAGTTREIVSNDEVAWRVIREMFDEGFRAAQVGDELHLFGPLREHAKPLPTMVRSGPSSVFRDPTSSAETPENRAIAEVGPVGTLVLPTGGNVVSLSDFRNRRQCQRDVLVLDGGAA